MKNEATVGRVENETDRNPAIQRIRTALRLRTGRAWSVRGGSGTAYGWITIDAPPSRQVCGQQTHDQPCGADCAHYRGYMSADDQAMLALALGLDRIHLQGVSIPAGHDYRREYIDRAEGRAPSAIGTPYWD